jgi:hypothetical protein
MGAMRIGWWYFSPNSSMEVSTSVCYDIYVGYSYRHGMDEVHGLPFSTSLVFYDSVSKSGFSDYSS